MITECIKGETNDKNNFNNWRFRSFFRWRDSNRFKTFENHQVFGLSTLTCLATAPRNHFQIHDLETSLVKEQLASIPAGSLDGIKIGLIHSEESMLQIATFLKSTQVCRWCWILSWLLKKRLQFMKKIHAVID